MTEESPETTSKPLGLFHIALLFACVLLEIGAGREIIRRALGKSSDLPPILMLPLLLGVIVHAIHWVITGNMAFTYYRERLVRAQVLMTRFIWAYFGVWAVSALLALLT